MGSLVIGGLCIALLAPAGASAVTIGSDLRGPVDPGTGYSCGVVTPICAIQPIAIPNDPNPVRAPFRGVIRKWRFRTVVDPATPYALRLAVVRKVAASAPRGGSGPSPEFRFVRRSRARMIDEAGRHRFRAHRRIRKGDYIALELDTGDGNVGINGFWTPNEGAFSWDWFPPPDTGESGSTSSDSTNIEFLFNASIRRRQAD